MAGKLSPMESEISMKTSVFALMLALASAALAIPLQINYQGKLADTGGAPLDTTVAMTFTVYTQSSGGTALWSETHPAVSVVDGIFTAKLGSVTVLDDFFINPVWLGVTVGGDSELSPREQFSSVAHAYRVGTVDGANGGTITGNVVGTAKGTFGSQSDASGVAATVSGGSGNTASGELSTVGGGEENTAKNN